MHVSVCERARTLNASSQSNEASQRVRGPRGSPGPLLSQERNEEEEEWEEAAKRRLRGSRAASEKSIPMRLSRDIESETESESEDGDGEDMLASA